MTKKISEIFTPCLTIILVISLSVVLMTKPVLAIGFLSTR